MQQHQPSASLVLAAGGAILGGAIATFAAVVYTRLTRDSKPPEHRRSSLDERGSRERGVSDSSVFGPSSPPVVRDRLRRQRRKTESGDQIVRIVLTGGPCGGKSSCLTQLVKRLQEQRYNVYVAPEMPTMLKQHCECPYPFKPNPTVADAMHALSWESNKMQLQADMEDALYDVARSSGERTVILCDRGLPDSAAYVSEDAFQTILDDHDWLLDKLMARYSLVVHLESAAIDTSLYNQLASNNAARHETEEEARDLDLLTQKAWASHPNVVMIRNCTVGEDFEKKKQLAVASVLEHLGLAASSSLTHRRLFRLHRHAPTSLFDREQTRCDFFTISSTFLRDVDGQSQDRVIERRGRVGGVWTYTLSHALSLLAASADAGESKRYIDEVRIGGRMYTGLLAEKDPNRQPVRRKERVFTYYVPAAGRDVVHRLVEVLGSSSANAAAGGAAAGGANAEDDAKMVRQRASFHVVPSTTSAADGGDAAAAAAAAASMEAGADNLEFLYVDGLEANISYEPPAFLAPFIAHEVESKAERQRYSLKALSQMTTGPC